MKHAKRIITILIISILTITAVFISYIGIENGAVVYAINQDGTLTNDELDIAISSFLQSHGGNIFSPQNYRARKIYEAGLIHNFIYGDGGGYDAVRNHIEGEAGGNNELRFNFDGFIIQKLNTWLNRELQNGTFGQGAELNENGMFNDDVNNTLYSGGLFTDDDGNNCLVYYISDFSISNTGVVAEGTPYLGVNGSSLQSSASFNSSKNLCYSNTAHIGGSDYAITFYDRLYNYRKSIFFESDQYSYSGTIYEKYERDNTSKVLNDGCLAIIFNTNNNVLSLGTFSYYLQNTSSTTYSKSVFRKYTITNNSNNLEQNININFITNNNNNISVYPTINEGDTLYITPKVNVGVDGQVNYQPYIVNEGDTINNVINQYYIDSNTPDKTISVPSDDPAGGGGGGGSSDGPGGNLPDWGNPFPHISPDGEGGFNFNFSLPDLNIDWNISGLTEKFPFSIPFDFVAFCRVLDAEPETPALQCDIDLKLVTWHVDYDLHQFDDIASLLRNLEFIAFCIALVIMTRNMIKG